jgi:uncharacterized protein involved in oxidation of intracellular sulfur
MGRSARTTALRLANALAKREGEHVRIFLMADAVGCAVAGQGTPNGYYNMERDLSAAARHGAEIGLCGTCMDARGVGEGALGEGRAPLKPRGARGLDAVGGQDRQLLNAPAL